MNNIIVICDEEHDIDPSKCAFCKIEELEASLANAIQQWKLHHDHLLLLEQQRNTNQEFVYAALGEIVNLIEICGASEKLTNAVTFTSDLRQAVGNQFNTPSEYAAERVKAAMSNVI